MNHYTPSRMPKGFPDLPADWVSQSAMYQSSDNETKLFAVIHKKDHTPSRKVLFVVHGLGEHGGRYLHFPHYLQSAVDTVVCIDLRGHGQSQGRRGHAKSFEQFADDIHKVILQIQTQLSGPANAPLETHFFAHSMGGLVGLLTLLKYSDLGFRSATISAPLLAAKVKIPVWKKAPAYALEAIWPTLTLPSGVDATLVSHDPEVIKAYLDDPLVHDKVTAQWFVDLQATMARVLAASSGINVPLLIVIPEGDLVVDHKVATKWAEEFQSSDKKILTLPGFYHEPFNEVEKDRPFKALNEWISGH